MIDGDRNSRETCLSRDNRELDSVEPALETGRCPGVAGHWPARAVRSGRGRPWWLGHRGAELGRSWTGPAVPDTAICHVAGECSRRSARSTCNDRRWAFAGRGRLPGYPCMSAERLTKKFGALIGPVGSSSPRAATGSWISWIPAERPGRRSRLRGRRRRCHQQCLLQCDPSKMSRSPSHHRQQSSGQTAGKTALLKAIDLLLGSAWPRCEASHSPKTSPTSTPAGRRRSLPS